MATSKKLKIGLVFDDSLDRPDGVQQYLLTLSRWLLDQGHDVSLLVGNSQPRNDLDVISLSRTVRIKFNGNSLRIPTLAPKRKISSIIEQKQLDIIHIQMPYSPLLAGRVIASCHHKNIPIIGTFHILPRSSLSNQANKLLYLIERRQLTYFSSIIANSKPTQAFIKHTYKQSSIIVPNMINQTTLKKLPANKKTNHIVISFLGRLVERKGCLYLLRSIAELAKRNDTNQFQVIVGGNGPLKSKLELFVKANSLEEYVNFIGFVPEKDKLQLLANSDITVFPSISGESFGIVLLEAMAQTSGVVLAGDNPGYRSLMEPFTKQLFNPLDTPTLTNLLDFYINNPKERHDAQKRQIAYANQFSVDKIGPKVLRQYLKSIN